MLNISAGSNNFIAIKVYEAVNHLVNKRAEWLFGGASIDPEQERFIQEIVKEMGITQPVYVRKMNSYATQKHGSVNVFVFGNYLFVGSNAFTELSLSELRFLIGHELSHMKNYHMPKAQLTLIGVWLPIIGSILLTYQSSKNLQFTAIHNFINNYVGLPQNITRNIGLGILGLGAMSVSSRVMQLLNAALKRCYEYAADRESAVLLNECQGGIDFMNRWKAYKSALGQPYDYSKLWNRLVASHPSPDARIAQLESIKQSLPNKD